MEHLVKLLFLLAAINILSSLTATLFDVERSAWTPAYINTHYITCAIGFTAWAHAAMATGDYFSEVFTFVMTVFGLAVSAAAFVADLGNIPVIRKLKATIPLHRMMKNLSTTEDMKPWLEATFNLQKQQFLTIYAILDGLTAFLAIPVCCLLLKKLLQSRFNMNRQATNVPLLGLGTALIVVAVLRGVIYISEIMTLRASPFVAVSFINYTIDEPAWIGVSVATGVLIVLSSRGSYLLRGVSLVSCGLLVWPAMFFMWIDYRALDTGLNRTMSPFSLSPMVSIVLAFMELGVLIATSLTLLQQFPTGSKVQLDVSVHRVFIGISIALLVIGFMTLSLDLYSAYEQVFYRLFHGSEQKLPFLCFILSIICYTCPNPTFAGAGLPLCLAMAILTINSTLFQIIAYLYLSYNNYMSEVICPLLQPKSCGTGADPITTEGTRLHLLETLLNFTVLILCSCICVLVTRIGRMRRVTERPEVTPAERDQVKRGERYILCLGVTMELQALLLFGVVLLSNMRNVDHPLIIMYGYLYHIALALALVIFSLYQIIVSEGLFEQPLAQNTLLTLTVARFVSTLTQLDYRNTGDGMDIEWRLHHLIDLFSLIFLFWTALITLGFGRLGKQSILDADEINLDFNNPLEESFNAAQDSGYVQLRPELDL